MRSRRLVASLAAALLLLAPNSPGLAQTEGEAPVEQAAPPVVSVPPASKDNCPPDYPVKGNRAGRQAARPTDPIYHVPGSRYYAATDPEECFATAADAEAAGYRAPLR